MTAVPSNTGREGSGENGLDSVMHGGNRRRDEVSSFGLFLAVATLLVAPAFPRYVYPAIGVRDRVPHDDRSELLQQVDSVLRDYTLAQLDAVQNRHARRALLALHERARQRKPRLLLRAHEIDPNQRERDQFLEERRAIFVVVVTRAGSGRRTERLEQALGEHVERQNVRDLRTCDERSPPVTRGPYCGVSTEAKRTQVRDGHVCTHAQ